MSELEEYYSLWIILLPMLHIGIAQVLYWSMNFHLLL